MPLELLELLVPLLSFRTCAINHSERQHVSQARAGPRSAFPSFFDIGGTAQRRAPRAEAEEFRSGTYRNRRRESAHFVSSKTSPPASA